MGDFNMDLLKCETSSYSHDFLSSLQSCFLIPSIDKPMRVRSSSATLIDNIFVNNHDNITACGNIREFTQTRLRWQRERHLKM